MTTIPPYPLQWPDETPRSDKRKKSQFRTGLSGAMANVRGSLDAFARDSSRKIERVVISSNVSLGLMRPIDPGVAVWFIWDGDLRCFPVDRYDKVECNLQAIHHIIEARRVELRHAGIQIVRATFRGFSAALPSPDHMHWSHVLGVPRTATTAQVQEAWRAKVRSVDESARGPFNIARDQAVREISNR